MTAADVIQTHAPAGASGPLAGLLERAYRFDFFQAVWLLERYSSGDTLVGQRGPVGRERLRFRPDLSLGFPPTDLRRILLRHHPETGEPYYQAEVAFLGLYGVSTPLPLHYAVEILRTAEPGLERAAGPEEALASSPVRDFLDLFHHRLISLFFRSWLKYHYERMFAAPQRDVITEYLGLLGGCPPTYDAGTLGVSPIRLLRYVGVFTQRPRSASTLAGLLFDYWGDIPVEVRQFVGQWVPLAPTDQNRLGQSSCRPGLDLTVGEEVYDLTGTFDIAVGPVDWETYLSLVPGGFRFRQTRALAKLYCCDPLAFTLTVTLRAGEVPETRLASDGQAGALGLTSWVRADQLGETSVTFAASEETPVRIGLMPAGPRDDSPGHRATDPMAAQGRGHATSGTQALPPSATAIRKNEYTP
jgi:type VI secretion system protein ImpH